MQIVSMVNVMSSLTRVLRRTVDNVGRHGHGHLAQRFVQPLVNRRLLQLLLQRCVCPLGRRIDVLLALELRLQCQVVLAQLMHGVLQLTMGNLGT